MDACSFHRQTSEEPQVRLAFTSCQAALLDDHLDQAMTYFPRNLADYFQDLNSGGPDPSQANWPAINQLVRTALDQKVPPDLRAHLTLQILAQRIIDEQLIRPDDIRKITIGRISVNGATATAALYYDGTLAPFSLSFLKEDGQWKIDLLALLPYVEFLLRIDRTLKGETVNQQVEQLVNPLPVL